MKSSLLIAVFPIVVCAAVFLGLATDPQDDAVWFASAGVLALVFGTLIGAPLSWLISVWLQRSTTRGMQKKFSKSIASGANA